MEIKEKLGAVEAILFASGEPVELYRLSQASGIDVGALPQLIRLLNERYDDCGSGITIKKLDSPADTRRARNKEEYPALECGYGGADHHRLQSARIEELR